MNIEQWREDLQYATEILDAMDLEKEMEYTDMEDNFIPYRYAKNPKIIPGNLNDLLRMRIKPREPREFWINVCGTCVATFSFKHEALHDARLAYHNVEQIHVREVIE
jgi:hypothetical protein